MKIGLWFISHGISFIVQLQSIRWKRGMGFISWNAHCARCMQQMVSNPSQRVAAISIVRRVCFFSGFAHIYLLVLYLIQHLCFNFWSSFLPFCCISYDSIRIFSFKKNQFMPKLWKFENFGATYVCCNLRMVQSNVKSISK